LTTADRIDAYAADVVDGRVPAGKYHRLACVRHQRDRDRERAEDPTFPYRFDEARALRFVMFAERLKHYKGEWARRHIVLTPIQVFRLGSIFGWVHRDTGLRRFRHSYNELPRKQGKTLEAAIVLLYLTFGDKEPGAEGYCTATKLAQSRLVFNDAKKLVRSSALKSRVRVRVNALFREQTASKAEPVSAGYEGLDGLNPHCVIVDEFHAHTDRGLIDVFETATGSRRHPHFFKITTAGDTPTSPCGDEHAYACQILDGVLDDESYFAVICHADPDDDPWSESTWRKANPHFGISINPDDLRALATKAKAMPAAAASFKQKRLNLWVNTTETWLSIDGWRAGQSTWPVDELAGASCWVGVDLASKLDLCPVVAIFPPTADRDRWRVLRWVFTPADTLADRAHRDRAPYLVWAEQGHLIAVPGTAVDHQKVRELLKLLATRYRIEGVGFDPWHADQLAKQLVEVDGFPEEKVTLVSQTFAGLSSACVAFEADVLAGRVDVQGDPLMEWCVSNVVVQRDGKDNLFPVKKKSRGRIDPVVAVCIAKAVHQKTPPVVESVYATRGLVSLGGTAPADADAQRGERFRQERARVLERRAA
jgi:phage terminase large subunit-like protein